MSYITSVVNWRRRTVTVYKSLRQIDKKLDLLYFNDTQDGATSFTSWCYETCTHAAPAFLEGVTIDGVHPHTRGQAPDVIERHPGKQASPERGHEDSTEQRVEHVAEALHARVARVREGPDAVHGVGAIGLGQYVLKLALKRVNG